MSVWKCPFCGEHMQVIGRHEYDCKNCKRIWEIELLDEYKEKKTIELIV